MKLNHGVGTHFMWENRDIRYNVLRAVGYFKGKPAAEDVLVPVSYTHLDVYKRQTLDGFMNEYQNAVEKFKTLQPDAVIYVQAIMHGEAAPSNSVISCCFII